MYVCMCVNLPTLQRILLPPSSSGELLTSYQSTRLHVHRIAISQDCTSLGCMYFTGPSSSICKLHANISVHVLSAMRSNSLRYTFPYPRHEGRRIAHFILNLSARCGPGQRRRYRDSLWAGRSGDRIPVAAKFSTPVQTDSWAHPTSWTMSTSLLPGGKSAGAWR